MLKRPPHMPTGVSIGMMDDGVTKVGVLTLQTLGDDVEIAINLEGVAAMTKALNALALKLRK